MTRPWQNQRIGMYEMRDLADVKGPDAGIEALV